MMRHESSLRLVQSVFRCGGQTTSDLSEWRRLTQVYLSIVISFPTLCLFTYSCVTTWVTHVWVPSDKSGGEFSAVSCSHLVHFDDSLCILTPPAFLCVCIIPLQKTVELRCHCPEMLRGETRLQMLGLFTNSSFLCCNQTSYHTWHAACQFLANNLIVITTAFEAAYVHGAVQKIFDEPRDCTGLHFIQRGTLSGK